MKPFKNILVTPLKTLVLGESAVPIVERLKGIAFLVDHSSLLVPSHCGQYFGKRIESDKIGDGEINLAQLGQRFLCFISGS